MEKKILVTRSSMPGFEEYVDEIRELWDSRWLTNMGKKHNELTEKLKEYLKVPGLELMVNGHSALEAAIQAFGFEKGSEVITTPFTFASTTHAIVRCGLKPVFADIDPKTCCLDPTCAESLITDKTVAILPVHVYGHICDVDAIDAIAKKHGLKVIYDAAHAFGETVDGRGVGSFGDASIFSFHATKVFHTIEGGCVCFSDPAYGKEIYYLKDFGIVDEENVARVGENGKMNEFAAAMGLCNLRHLEGEIESRAQVVKRYRQHLSSVPGISLGMDYEGTNIKSNNAYFPAIFGDEFPMDRDEVHRILGENNIGARKYFYPLTNSFDCYKDCGYDPKRDTPVAWDISKRVLTLPLFAHLPLEDVDRICSIITGVKL
ncbi:MAG: DegT/DnrJ/EryC1/StrS family aminotransferase [Lachnospiraceae bacterium]|nr:DegT/DnrJ/EryC1/StrS family aminotransferase [Lachnospiraceae bacterium]